MLEMGGLIPRLGRRTDHLVEGKMSQVTCKDRQRQGRQAEKDQLSGRSISSDVARLVGAWVGVSFRLFLDSDCGFYEDLHRKRHDSEARSYRTKWKTHGKQRGATILTRRVLFGAAHSSFGKKGKERDLFERFGTLFEAFACFRPYLPSLICGQPCGRRVGAGSTTPGLRAKPHSRASNPGFAPCTQVPWGQTIFFSLRSSNGEEQTWHVTEDDRSVVWSRGAVSWAQGVSRL